MDPTQILIYIALPFIVMIGGAYVRGIMQRLDRVEAKVDTKVTDEEVRQLLDDKILPISEDLKYIRDKIDKFTETLIQKNS